MQAALGVGKKMFPAFIKYPIIAYRLEQIADTFLCTIMKENVLAKQVVKPVFTCLFKRPVDPAILGRMQMTADGKVITTVEKLFQFGVAHLLIMIAITIATADPASHRLYRNQAIHLAVQQGCKWKTGIVFGFVMCLTQQAVQIGVALMILRYQYQRILQD